MRMTHATARVLQALEAGCRYGFEIIESTRVRSGTVYPLLRRLEESGLVRSRWEDIDVAREESRPARKYYELTDRAAPALAAATERFPTADRLSAENARG